MADISETRRGQHSEYAKAQRSAQQSVTLRVDWVGVLALLFLAGMIASAIRSYDPDAPRQSAIYQYAPKTWISAP